MDNINLEKIQKVSMDVFMHLKGSSYMILDRFKKLVDSKVVDVDDIKLITINYNTSTGDAADAPVRIYLSSGVVIYLNLAAGFNGSGPTDLCAILRLCEIDFNKDDITSPQEEVNLRYLRPDGILYQFMMHDGTYEYSM